MPDNDTTEHKRIGWKELLSGVGLGGLASFLTTQPFRKAVVEGLTVLERNLTRAAIKEYKDAHPKPKPSDFLGSSSEVVDEVVGQWKNGLKDHVTARIGALDKRLQRLDTVWPGTWDTLSATTTKGKLAIGGAGVVTLLGAVMLVNHFRNKNKTAKADPMEGKLHVDVEAERRGVQSDEPRAV